MTEEEELIHPHRRNNDSGTLGHINATAILQAITIAVIIWFGSKVVAVSEVIAVHEWRLNELERYEFKTQGEKNVNNGNGEGKSSGFAQRN